MSDAAHLADRQPVGGDREEGSRHGGSEESVTDPEVTVAGVTEPDSPTGTAGGG